tara:strand:- start:223 stop:459 length:237 start_codon:yes stop_codon:yes gene_type:complete
MFSKIRKKVTDDLVSVASEECISCGEAVMDMGTVHESLINLAYRYAPIKELRRLIVEGKEQIEENYDNEDDNEFEGCR